MIAKIIYAVCFLLISANAFSADFTNLKMMDSRINSYIYTPDGWSIKYYEVPEILVSDPEVRTYATFNTSNPRIRGEVRIIKKGQLDAATILATVAEQTIDATLKGADVIFGTRDLGGVRMLYEDSQGKQYVEQVLSADDIAVTIIFSIDKNATDEEKMSVAAVLNKSEISVKRQ